MSTDTNPTNPTTITAEEGTPYLEVVRDFDCTPAQLFRAHTDPKLVARWLGPRDLEMDVEEYDARPGGSYRYIHHGGHLGDRRAAFHGVFHTVKPDLIVQTFEFEGAPDEVVLGTYRIQEADGRTRLITRSVFPSTAAREAALASGMEYGIRDSMDRLAELLTREV